MKNSGSRLLVITGTVAGTALFAGAATWTLRASANAGQPPKVGDTVIRTDVLKNVRDLPTLTPVPALVPNGRARDRGCRTGGIKNINVTNPSWVSVNPNDTPTALEGIVRISKVTHEDFPTNHESHDWNFMVAPDPAYNGLMSDANDLIGNVRLIECEWETRHFPDLFLPAPGDRAYVLGRWIFDCGHPPYRSEIHPPKLTAFTRLEPHVFRGDAVPSFTNKTFVFVNGQGGYFYDPVGRTNYEFYVPLPPKPSPSAVARAEIVSVPLGGVSPVLTLEPEQNRVKVVYPLGSLNETANRRWNLYADPLSRRPPRSTARFGAIIASGWREARSTRAYKVFRVDLNSIKINEDHDPLASGEWHLWVRVNGVWGKLRGLGDVDNGQTIGINRSIQVTIPDNGEITLQATGWESDPIDGSFSMDKPGSLPSIRAADNNDKIGTFLAHWTARNNFGIGLHDEKSRQNGDGDTRGDYQLRYRITEVARFPVGTLNGVRPIPGDRVPPIDRLKDIEIRRP